MCIRLWFRRWRGGQELRVAAFEALAEELAAPGIAGAAGGLGTEDHAGSDEVPDEE